MSADLFETTSEILDISHLDVEVHSVLTDLLFRNLLE